MASLIKARQTGPARVRLRKHLDLHPDDAQATFLFGLSYHREKRYAEAVPHYERALELAPEYQLTHYFYAWALYYLGQPQQAREHFESFLAQRPTDGDTHFGLGLLDLDEDNLDAAELHFKQAIALFIAEPGGAKPAELAKAYARLGEVHERRGDLEPAREALEMAVKSFPDAYEAQYKLYRVLMRLGQPQRAEEVRKEYLAARERVRPGTAFPDE